MSEAEPSTSGPLVFGEVLFDHFEDGSRVLGGAPFNVAWHLEGFGLAPLFVSAVGTDEEGREVIERMESWGMRTDGLQAVVSHPTGAVTAKIVDGEPVYEIGTEQAYDHVERHPARAALGDEAPSLIYHGTLALRTETSRETLSAIQDQTSAPTYVDLNLRRPWWTAERVERCLERADWLKLAADELATVIGRPAESVEACEVGARHLVARHGLDAVIVTRGAWGSLMVRETGSWTRRSEALAPEEIVDTVGAGDAFSAVACTGVVEGWHPETVLERGNAFALELCRIRGATTTDRGLYERHRRRWTST